MLIKPQLSTLPLFTKLPAFPSGPRKRVVAGREVSEVVPEGTKRLRLSKGVYEVVFVERKGKKETIIEPNKALDWQSELMHTTERNLFEAAFECSPHNDDKPTDPLLRVDNKLLLFSPIVYKLLARRVKKRIKERLSPGVIFATDQLISQLQNPSRPQPIKGEEQLLRDIAAETYSPEVQARKAVFEAAGKKALANPRRGQIFVRLEPTPKDGQADPKNPFRAVITRVIQPKKKPK